MRKRYEAFDGTLFDTIQECEEYEGLKIVNTFEKDGNLKGWTAFFTPVATKRLVEDPGLADYLYIGNQLALDAVTKYIEVDADDGTFGFFVWDEDLQYYVPLEEYRFALQAQIIDIQNRLDNLDRLEQIDLTY